MLNLGKVVRSDVGPGLHFKWPLVESARIFDRRLQVLDAEPERYFTSEQKDVSVDFFAIGRIEDVRAFFRATGGDESIAIQRLAPIIKDSLRNEFNSRTLQQWCPTIAPRSCTPARRINRGAATLGVKIIDIRIKRIDLPEDSDVIKSVYERMRAQRQQVASRCAPKARNRRRDPLRSRPRAAVIAADAERDAQKLRGEGDASAAKIYADAYGRDPGFYAFHRSLEAYRKSFADGNAVIVLDRNDPFLQYMRSDR